jgi:hypothetical protein
MVLKSTAGASALRGPGMEMRVIGDEQCVHLGQAERHAEGSGERAAPL